MIPRQYIEAGCAFESDSDPHQQVRAIGYRHMDILKGLVAEKKKRHYPLLAQAQRIAEEMEYVARFCKQIYRRGMRTPGMEEGGIFLKGWATNVQGYFLNRGIGVEVVASLQEKWALYNYTWDIFELVLKKLPAEMYNEIEEVVRKEMQTLRLYRQYNILARLRNLEGAVRDRDEKKADKIEHIFQMVHSRFDGAETGEGEEMEIYEIFGCASLSPDSLDQWLKGQEAEVEAHQRVRTHKILQKTRAYISEVGLDIVI